MCESDQDQINARIDAIDGELAAVDYRDASSELLARVQALHRERSELLQALDGQDDPCREEFGHEADYLELD